MLYQKIKALAKEKKIPICKIEEQLEIAQGSICKWGTISPSYDKVVGVAKILGVSVEELLKQKGTEWEKK